MKGTLKTPYITWEEILEKTNYGYDVFRAELGNFPLNKCFNSPLRKDRNPSFSVLFKSGIWWYKDFATGDSGTALQFIQKRHNLSYKEALERLTKEFSPNENSVKITWKKPIIDESEVFINFSYIKWKKQHHKFWENTPVNEAHCRKYETYAVKDASINRRKVNIIENEVVWAYYAPEIDKTKLYFPEREKGKRFKGNAPGGHLWNLKNIGECDKLVVIKSMKDLLISTVLTPCTIATQNESSRIFTEDVVNKLNSLSKEIFICYGADDQGRDESIKITKENKWKWVNTPKNLLPDINDIYLLAKYKGIEAVEKLYKSKNII